MSAPPTHSSPGSTLPAVTASEVHLPPARISDLWATGGLVSQRTYVGWGLGLTALKYNLDRLLAGSLFHQGWTPLDYLLPGSTLLRGFLGSSTGHLDADPAMVRFGATMFAFSLPFLWAGVAMTHRRLRTLRLPPALIGVFLVPGVNLLLLAVLAILPDPLPSSAREPAPGQSTKPDLDHGSRESQVALLERILPTTALGAAAAACALVIPPAIGLTLASVFLFRTYGYALFLGIPFWLGLSASLLYGFRQPRSLLTCLGVGLAANALCGLSLFAMAIEGVVCLIMAAPLAIVLGAFGSGLGYLLQRDPGRPAPVRPLLPMLLLLLPGVMGMEYLAPPPIPTYRVDTSLEIQAPPSEVWKHVLAFPQLDPPSDWLFSTGIAYPIHATIEGEGVGAVRHCVFSTGEFVEPIEVWDPPRRLAFSVTHTPHPMTEWTPYPGAPPPHLEEFMVSKGGEFRLVALPEKRTRLEGTTWYQHHMWPGIYWHQWAAWIMHRIHLRVLRHIQRRAEGITTRRGPEEPGGPGPQT